MCLYIITAILVCLLELFYVLFLPWPGLWVLLLKLFLEKHREKREKHELYSVLDLLAPGYSTEGANTGWRGWPSLPAGAGRPLAFALCAQCTPTHISVIDRRRVLVYSSRRMRWLGVIICASPRSPIHHARRWKP